MNNLPNDSVALLTEAQRKTLRLYPNRGESLKFIETLSDRLPMLLDGLKGIEVIELAFDGHITAFSVAALKAMAAEKDRFDPSESQSLRR